MSTGIESRGRSTVPGLREMFGVLWAAQPARGGLATLAAVLLWRADPEDQPVRFV